MSTFYRIASGPDSVNEKISFLTTRMEGFKVKNSFDLSNSAELMYGIDYSVRNWDGHYEGDGMQRLSMAWSASMMWIRKIKPYLSNSTRTMTISTCEWVLVTTIPAIEPAGTFNEPSNDYTAFSGFVFGTYLVNNSTKLFGGLGRPHRVPDARELYFHGSMISPMGMAMSPQLGTPTLDQTTNTEIDFGVENNFSN